MRWLTIAIFAYVLLGLEQGMAVGLSLPGGYSAAPGLLLILMVFIGLSAPSQVALWAAVALGLLYDLAHPVMVNDAHGAANVVILGPGAIAFLLGTFVLLRSRVLVYRGSLISIVLFTFIAGIFVHLAIVFIFALRGVPFAFFPGEQLVGWSWSGELVRRFLSLCFTAFLALPVGWVLLRCFGMFAFEQPKGHGTRR